jgi:hypothetical protein
VLVEKMIPPVQIKKSVRVVQPATAAGEVVLRPFRRGVSVRRFRIFIGEGKFGHAVAGTFQRERFPGGNRGDTAGGEIAVGGRPRFEVEAPDAFAPGVEEADGDFRHSPLDWNLIVLSRCGEFLPHDRLPA